MLTSDKVKKIAHLARLNLSPEDVTLYTPQLSQILTFIEQMNQTDTATVEPLAHPVEVSQRLRPDVITEMDEHEKFQQIAPQVEMGLYLVPKVLDET